MNVTDRLKNLLEQHGFNPRTKADGTLRVIKMEELTSIYGTKDIGQDHISLQFVWPDDSALVNPDGVIINQDSSLIAMSNAFTTGKEGEQDSRLIVKSFKTFSDADMDNLNTSIMEEFKKGDWKQPLDLSMFDFPDGLEL